MAVWAPSVQDTEKAILKVFSFSMNQAAGTYTIGTVSGGDIVIQSIIPYVSVAGVGLTSVAVQTDDTTVTTILATTLLAALTGGKNLAILNTPFYLPSGKHIQGTIVGAGSGGNLQLAVLYYRVASGAVIS